MALLKVNDSIELEVESFGDPEDAAIVLIIGLGGQLVRWDESFCVPLAARGRRVIRFDHRDVGLSTKLEAAGTPDVAKVLTAVGRGESPEVPYRLEDMADDVIGLLDALDIAEAHVAGSSMGGMIAQLLAIGHPNRIRSITSLMSTTGDRNLPPPTPEAIAHLMSPEPIEREENVAHHVRGSQIMGGSLPFDEDFARRRAERAYDRCFYPDGGARHLLASMVAENRREALGSLQLPSLVIHGGEDPLVRPECGVATADAIPGAKLEVVKGMGHDLRPSVFPILVDLIANHTAD